MERKKLRYVPGLISLLGLPFILITMGPEEPIYPVAPRIYLPSEKVSEQQDSMKFTKAGIYESIKNKKLITIYLEDGNRGYHQPLQSYRQETRFKFLRTEIERLQFTHDTNSVLRVQLDENNDYGEFMWVMNQTIIHDIKRWAFVDDSFILLANDPPKHYPPTEDMQLYVREYNIEYKEPSAWDMFLWSLNEKFSIWTYMLKMNKLLIAGFIVLIFFPAMIKTFRVIKTYI